MVAQWIEFARLQVFWSQVQTSAFINGKNIGVLQDSIVVPWLNDHS
jgi:hypothetical protein